MLPLLADAGWAAATYDQRGQFETVAADDDDLSLSGLAADAITLVHATFGSDEQVHLVGHSFGGLVAAEAAIGQPEVWASLTLMCSGPGQIAGERLQVSRQFLTDLDALGPEGAYAETLRRERSRLASPEVVPPEVQAFLRERFLRNSVRALQIFADHLATTPDRTAELAGLPLPVAVLRGEDDDAWDHEVQDRLANALGSKVIVIADAAHSPAVEQPEQTRDALVRIWLG